MKVFVKLIVLVLMLALAGPFFIKGPDGQALMQFSDIKRSASAFLSDSKQAFSDAKIDASRALGDEQAGNTEVYRWQDANGQWHYTNEKPSNAGVETVYVDPNVVKMAKPKPSRSTSKTAATTSAKPEVSLPPGIMTPGRVKQAIDETTNVKDKVEERQAEIEKQVEDM